LVLSRERFSEVSMKIKVSSLLILVGVAMVVYIPLFYMQSSPQTVKTTSKDSRTVRVARSYNYDDPDKDEERKSLWDQNPIIILLVLFFAGFCTYIKFKIRDKIKDSGRREEREMYQRQQFQQQQQQMQFQMQQGQTNQMQVGYGQPMGYNPAMNNPGYQNPNGINNYNYGPIN